MLPGTLAKWIQFLTDLEYCITVGYQKRETARVKPKITHPVDFHLGPSIHENRCLSGVIKTWWCCVIRGEIITFWVTLVESDSLGICPSWGKTLGNLSSSQGRTGKRQAGKVLYHDLWHMCQLAGDVCDRQWRGHMWQWTDARTLSVTHWCLHKIGASFNMTSQFTKDNRSIKLAIEAK